MSENHGDMTTTLGQAAISINTSVDIAKGER